MDQFNRITDPTVMGGKACIRGMRVTVGNISIKVNGEKSLQFVTVWIFCTLFAALEKSDNKKM